MVSRVTYPIIRRSGHVDIYQSEKNSTMKVLDPYRYLEGKGQEVDDFVQVQSKLPAEYIAGIAERSHLEALIRKSSNYTKFSAPTFTRDGRYYWNYNSATSKEFPDFANGDGKPGGEVFLDPNYLTKDTGHMVPKKKKEKKKKSAGRMDDEIKLIAKSSSIVWTPDSKGFFYQRYSARAPNAEAIDAAGTKTDKDQISKLYYHKLGTPQEDDILMMRNDDGPHYMRSTSIASLDSRYLALYVSRDTGRQNLLWITDLDNASNPIGPDMKWVKLINEWDAEYSIVTNDGPRMYIKTNKDAPNYRVVTIDISDADSVANLRFKPFINEDPEAPIQQIKVINEDEWVIAYSRDVNDAFSLRGA